MKRLTFKSRILGRIDIKIKESSKAIDKTGPNSSTFWQGYKAALEEVKQIVEGNI